MVEVKSSGDFNKFRHFLNKLKKGAILFDDLDQYGQLGVQALATHTPVDTGLAQHSWEYRIVKGHNFSRIEWFNTDIESGTLVVLLVQYGHATRGGTYIQGHDFINPAMKPVFDHIINDVRKKVKS